MNTALNTDVQNIASVRIKSEVITVRPVLTDADWTQLRKFRYQIYVKGMNRDLATANHVAEEWSDSFDSWASHFAAFQGERLVGCIRVNYSCDGHLPDAELYQYSKFGVNEIRGLVSKAMVDPNVRGTGILFELARRVAIESLNRGIGQHFLATSDRLVPLFGRIGFTKYDHRDSWADYGTSNPMFLDLFDLETLKIKKSALVELVTEFINNRKVA